MANNRLISYWMRHHHVVGICEFKDGFRVAKDATNIFWWPDRHTGTDCTKDAWVELDIPNPKQLYKAFIASPVFSLRYSADEYAFQLVEELAKTKNNVYIKFISGYNNTELK